MTVTQAGTGTYTQQITAGHHELVADEPRPISDYAGPTPYDLLLAALGSCTSMMVRMYADRKGWPLERVRVTLRHSRIHASDCAECETTKGWIDHIDRDVELTGALDATQTGTADVHRRPVPRSSDPDFGGSHHHDLGVRTCGRGRATSSLPSDK